MLGRVAEDRPGHAAVDHALVLDVEVGEYRHEDDAGEQEAGDERSSPRGSLRVKWLDLAVARGERLPMPACGLRTGLPDPGNLILIATFMSARKSRLMIDGAEEILVI